MLGTGKSAAADGSKFETYENNLLCEYHVRYGGYGALHHHVSIHTLVVLQLLETSRSSSITALYAAIPKNLTHKFYLSLDVTFSTC